MRSRALDLAPHRTDFDAGHFGHVDVQKDKIRRMPFQCGQSVFAVHGKVNAVARCLQNGLHHLAVCAIVIRNQHPARMGGELGDVP